MSMEKKMEDFIANNREAFDDREPSEKVWSRIQTSLFQKGNWINAVPFWRAAAVLFMAATAFLLTQRVWNTKEQEVSLREFQDVETFYINQIAFKIELIEANSDSEGALNGFTRDFHQLEAMYQVLKEEMTTRPSKQVKDALVLNLLVRIDLLNQQLHKLEKSDIPTDAEARASV